MLGDLRVSPFNLQTGNSFQVKVLAKSLQGDSLASSPASATMPASTCSGGGFIRTALPDLDVDIEAPPADSNDAVSVNSDDNVPTASDDGQEPQDSNDEELVHDDTVHLKADNFDAGFTADAASEDEGSKHFNLGVVTGVIVGLGVVTLVAVGIFAYIKAT